MTLFIIIEIFDFPPEKCQGVIFNQEKISLHSKVSTIQLLWQQHPSKIEEGKKWQKNFSFSLDCFQVAAASHQKQDGQQNHFRKIANVVLLLSSNVMNSPTRHQNKYYLRRRGKKSEFRKTVFQRLFFSGLNLKIILVFTSNITFHNCCFNMQYTITILYDVQKIQIKRSLKNEHMSPQKNLLWLELFFGIEVYKANMLGIFQCRQV